MAPELVERLAEALGDRDGDSAGWVNMTEAWKNKHRSAVAIVLAEIEAAGHKVVPAAPTNDMMIAGLQRSLDWMAEHGVTASSPFNKYPNPGETIKTVFSAMLAAAPKLEP